jgi:hypothetical protein
MLSSSGPVDRRTITAVVPARRAALVGVVASVLIFSVSLTGYGWAPRAQPSVRTFLPNWPRDTSRPVRGGQVDVSRAPGAQSEVAIAVDPSRPQVLVAGSNNFPGPTMRAYGSTDGGARWTSANGPPLPAGSSACGASDPAVAIDGAGRQYYAFLAVRPCSAAGRVGLYVATRSGPEGIWRTRSAPVAPRASGAPRTAFVLNDRPFLAVDDSPASRYRGRVYLAWSRLVAGLAFDVSVSHTEDGGETWSPPVQVTDGTGMAFFASAAVARDGTLYVAWLDREALRIRLTRSNDGGASFGQERTAARYSAYSLTCRSGGAPIPAQPARCSSAGSAVSVDDSVGARSGRVYVTYDDTGRNGALDVFLAAFDRQLRPLAGIRRVNPPDGATPSDQFLPVSAIDTSDGRLWVCFYDTSGDRRRVRARFSCSVSATGGKTWSPIVPAASVASDEAAPGARREFAYGDFEGLAVADGVAHPIWTDTRDLARLGEEIYTTTLTAADVH